MHYNNRSAPRCRSVSDSLNDGDIFKGTWKSKHMVLESKKSGGDQVGGRGANNLHFGLTSLEREEFGPNYFSKEMINI